MINEHIKNTFNRCLSISEKKNADYAGDADPFANFRKSEVVGVPVEQGILVRLMDKVSRVSNLLEQEAQVKDEKIQDTIEDAINYLAILLAYIEEGKDDDWNSDEEKLKRTKELNKHLCKRFSGAFSTAPEDAIPDWCGLEPDYYIERDGKYLEFDEEEVMELARQLPEDKLWEVRIDKEETDEMLLGVDTAVEDKGCKVFGRREKDGTTTITRVEYDETDEIGNPDKIDKIKTIGDITDNEAYPEYIIKLYYQIDNIAYKINEIIDLINRKLK